MTGIKEKTKLVKLGLEALPMAIQADHEEVLQFIENKPPCISSTNRNSNMDV